jgi:hypothetical protein
MEEGVVSSDGSADSRKSRSSLSDDDYKRMLVSLQYCLFILLRRDQIKPAYITAFPLSPALTPTHTHLHRPAQPANAPNKITLGLSL